MSELKLNRLNIGDSQVTLIGKINQNFREVISFFGGPFGKNGVIGNPGPIGPIGPTGPKGMRGERGSFWFFSISSPSTGPGQAIVGDYWVNVLDNNSIYQLTPDDNWEYQNINLKSSTQFTRLSNISGPMVMDAIVQSSANPETNNFSLNSIPGSSTTINPQYSRVFLETNPGLTSGSFDQTKQPLVEFTKTLPLGSTGNSSNSALLQWDTTSNQYGISFHQRRGGIDLDFPAGIELLSASGSFIGESYRDSVSINSSSSDFFFDGSFSWFDQDTSKKTLRILSNNFRLDLSPDYSILNSPIYSYYNDTISGVSSTNRFGTNITNTIPASNSIPGGGNLEMNVNISSGAGLLWKGNYPAITTKSSGNSITTSYEDTLKLTSAGELKMTREIRFGNDTTKNSPVSHGSYSGTTYYWLGVVPSQHTVTSMTSAERIDWDGEEIIVVETSSAQDIGLYLQGYLASNYYSSDRALRIRVIMGTSGKYFKAVGIGTFYSGSFYPVPTITSNSVRQWDAIPSPYATVIEFFVLPPPPNDVVNGNNYTVYYEAYGASGGVSNGILYS